ncbi:hypothetical protein KFL_000030350 [Klebsormidium nitens]|uniref:Complex 1 LYR protein domain-containing protein n=1 Tax=Klebsormidium nitens TaxID=105231 RepID=A0A1Y1HMI2_KLENI|nr:hypothetical protein KFL_000030350 [Klebsormidium nitens]|eukprot:GAQ77757.1 hypothetical protein KFL_000030350 [Klebsormidium nitens]
MSSSAAALAGFRHLLRAQRKSFAGDSVMQAGAVKEIRSHFEKNRDASDPEEVQKLVAGCYDAADFLSTFVVQAELNDRGNYEMKLQPEHAEKVAEDVGTAPTMRPPITERGQGRKQTSRTGGSREFHIVPHNQGAALNYSTENLSHWFAETEQYRCFG